MAEMMRMGLERSKRQASLLFAMFFTVVFVRTIPFSPRKAYESVEGTGGGDISRQLLLLAFFAVIALPLIWRRPAHFLQNLGYPFLAFLAYCLITLAWSEAPHIGARRLGLAVVISTCLVAGVAMLSTRDLLVNLRRVLIGLTLASLIAGLLLPNLAIHQPADPERAIVGAWRGLFYHKNIAGITAGLAILFCIDMAVTRKRPYDGVIALALCALTLWLTNSITSMAAAAAASLYFFASLLFLRWQRERHQRVIFQMAIGCATICAAGVVWLSFDWVSYLADPRAFTGRGRVWDAVADLIARRPLTGYGYESVFQVGSVSPLTPKFSDLWLQTIAHSHNGWLDILVTIGLIGASLYIICFIIEPFRQLLGLPAPMKRETFPLLTSLIIFSLAHSLLEGRMLAGDGQIFMTLVIVMSLSRKLHAAERSPHGSLAERAPQLAGHLPQRTLRQ